MAIGSLTSQSSIPQISKLPSGDQKAKGTNGLGGNDAVGSFSNMLTNGVKEVDGAVKAYENIASQFASGERVNIHELVIKGEQADVSLRLMAAMKSKIVEAYQEVMRMPV